MEKLIADLLSALNAIQPRANELGDIDKRLAVGQADLVNLTSQLDKLRADIRADRDSHAAEVHARQKAHADTVYRHQTTISGFTAELANAKAELTQVQNDIAKYSRKLQEISIQYNKEIKAVA